MERALRSKSETRYAARPPKDSGVIIRDDNNISNNITHTQIPNTQELFKRDANLYLPMTNIIKIMRSTLPENTKIADDAKETVQECVSEFIDHITREANAICHRDHRKTIIPEDLLSAMGTTKFHNYAETLTQFWRKRREEDLARNFIRGTPLVLPSDIEAVMAQDHVAQKEVDHEPHNGLTGPMDDFYRSNVSEGSSSGPTNDDFYFSLEEFDVFRQFK